MSVHGSEQPQVMERFVDGLGGSHRYILDYLLEEVLSREPDHVREFLLRTCLLERFNADLCAALCSEETDAAAAQSMLEALERANLFIVPLDNQREWFRFHHLFADVLQKQLLHTRPGLAPDLHRRAADWFERQGMIEEAIIHAQRCGDPSLPLALVEKYALAAILRGQVATATHWLDSLPAEVLLASPRLCLDRAWALTFTFQTEAAVPYFERAAALTGDAPESQAEILGLQSYRENTYGHADEALRLARLALEHTPTNNMFLHCCNRLFLAGALSHAGRLDEAVQEYQSLQSQCQMNENLAGLAVLEADFLHDLAIFLYTHDEVARAKNLLQQAIQNMEAQGKGRQPAALYLYVGLGKIHFSENEMDESERLLEKGLQLEPLTLSVGALDGWLALWRTKLSQGDRAAAHAILERLERDTRGRDEKVVRMVTLSVVLQDLLEKNIEHAASRLEKFGLSADVDGALAQVTDSELMGWRLNEYFTYARLLIAQRNFPASLKVLRRMQSAAFDFHMEWVAHRARMSQAIAHAESGDVEDAMRIMTGLLATTSKLDTNPVRIYLAAGEVARTLLTETQRRGIYPEHVSGLLAAFPPEATPVKPAALPESLTERELDVLRLMADGLKNQEIGAKLFISLNTIRYHTTNIFGKLSVDNRTAAVVRARQMGLLDSRKN
jgi:LuxR family maltose regulon positive regulatory protein